MADHTFSYPPHMGRSTATKASPATQGASFPLGAGLLLGLGAGGFFDGIVFHQLLQWHHMLSSAGYSADTLEGLEFNTLADGLFHAATYLLLLAGLAWLWAAGRKPHFRWAPGLLAASMLIGFGFFNMVEGVVNHQILGLHHVNETVPRDQWVYWDMAFFAWGVAMAAGGWALLRRQRAQSALVLATGTGKPGTQEDVDLFGESVAGEEDPGASLDLSAASATAGNRSAASPMAPSSAPLNPGDEAPEGTPGTGEGICRECGGSGRVRDGVCPSCNGSGKVTVGVGGA